MRIHMSNQSVNPRTGEKFGIAIEDTSAEEIESIITLSQQSFLKWSTFSTSLRAKGLNAIADALDANTQGLAE